MGRHCKCGNEIDYEESVCYDCRKHESERW
jgi:hypothetical protein